MTRRPLACLHALSIRAKLLSVVDARLGVDEDVTSTVGEKTVKPRSQLMEAPQDIRQQGALTT